MKKRKIWHRILPFVLTVAMLAGFYPQNPFYFSLILCYVYIRLCHFLWLFFECKEWNEKTIRHNIFFEGVVNENVRDLF